MPSEWMRAVAMGLLAFVPGVSLSGCSRAPAEDTSYWDDATWYQDYFAVREIGEGTYAIAEPKYFRKNVNYLIVGDERAVLLDSGPGKKDLKAVLSELTDRPVTAVFSHTHNDHIGHHDKLDHVALADLPSLRERTRDGVFKPTFGQFAVPAPRPKIEVDEWWAPGETIDLGGRKLEVLHIPGHTPESIALLDRERNELFTGDFIYARRDLFTFSPGGTLEEYLASAKLLIQETDDGVKVLGAHAAGDPRLKRQDILDLQSGLESILDRTGEWDFAWYQPLVYPTPLRRYRSGELVLLTTLFL